MIAEQFAGLRADGDWQPSLEQGLAALRQRRTATQQRRRRWIISAAGAMAACVPIMAFPVTRALAARCVSACVLETAAVQEILLGKAAGTAPSTAYINPVDRRIAPDFTLNDASGRTIRLSDYRGKVVLLNFWATWCLPCRQEIPWFMEFERSNAQRGFAVLGVSMDQGWKSVTPYVDRMGMNYPVTIGNDEIARRFGGLDSIPLTLIIDRSGRIAAVHAGVCKKDQYDSEIEAVLGEK